MTNKLQLSPAASITHNSNGILLRSDLGDFQLQGRDISDFIHLIYPLLNGQHDQQQICQALPQYDDNSIKSVLQLLKQHGLIEPPQDHHQLTPPWPAHERFLQAWDSSSEPLRSTQLLVIGLDPWSVKMIDELANAGIGHIHMLDNNQLDIDDVMCHRQLQQKNIGQSRPAVVKTILGNNYPWCQISHEPLQLNAQQQLQLTQDYRWDLVIVTLGNDAQDWLSLTAEYIHQHKYQALYGNLNGLEARLGPVVLPAGTGCWNCARLRILAAASNPQQAHELENSTNPPRKRTLLSPMAASCGQQLAMEALKLLLNYTPSNLIGKIQVQNLINHTNTQHKIIPIPWCPTCQFNQQQATQHQPITALAQINDIQQLSNALAGIVDPLTGIIRQLTGHMQGLPDHPVTATASLCCFTTGSFDSTAMGQLGSGKGLDQLSAYIGAIGEAIERYSAARYNINDCKYANIHELKADYIAPQTQILYSASQYQQPDFPFAPLDPNQKLHWTQGRWLGSDIPVWVPSLICYFNFAAPAKEQFCQVSSNGLAAGQDHTDAAMRASYELIERDAMMLTWYAQLPCQRLKIDSQYQGKMRLLIDDLSHRGIQLELYLLDVGIKVPTVLCLGLGDGITTPAASVALACHGDIKIAMSKAILEQGHISPYLSAIMATTATLPQRVDEVTSIEDHATYYFSKDKLKAFDFIRQDTTLSKDISELNYPKINNEQQLQQRLMAAGVKISIVDTTSPDISLTPFKVARAIGTYMQPIHFGEQFKRLNNPRLKKLLKGRPANENPHPVA